MVAHMQKCAEIQYHIKSKEKHSVHSKDTFHVRSDKGGVKVIGVRTIMLQIKMVLMQLMQECRITVFKFTNT